MLIIKPEQRTHQGQVRRIHELAFGRPQEAALVDALRSSGSFIKALSLVAQLDGQIVGHILFSRILIKNGDRLHDGVSLAPLAVLPDFQNMGIGSQLVRYGLEKCDKLGCKMVVVLGNRWYYTRFGFERASLYGVAPPFPLEDEGNFMVYAPKQEFLSQISGTVLYPQPFEQI